MKKKLHLLVLEDNAADAELAVRELEKEGFVVEWSLVETEKAFREALNQRPEVILADYSLPSFDGLSALKIKQVASSAIPLIIVSGSIGEEFAIECIKAGATDYVLKDKLFRLGPVIKRALKEAEEYRERKQTEEKVFMLQSLQNAISKINQLLVRVKNESELFQTICNILIKVEYVKFAWIGLTNKEDLTIKPVAQAGFEEDYLSLIKVTWDDSEDGNEPTGIALKTSRPFIMSNIEADPKLKPWKNDALKRGYLSSIALPLIYKKEPIGALNVYSGMKDAFGDNEVRLNLPRFTGQQDKTIINLMEVQGTWKERKDNLPRNLKKRQ
ncbi:MAG: GAF domain-containing protein [Atribacterota bacterium]|nr:GAF domain-containing protein [Atribacterota bacterium]